MSLSTAWIVTIVLGCLLLILLLVFTIWFLFYRNTNESFHPFDVNNPEYEDQKKKTESLNEKLFGSSKYEKSSSSSTPISDVEIQNLINSTN